MCRLHQLLVVHVTGLRGALRWGGIAGLSVVCSATLGAQTPASVITCLASLLKRQLCHAARPVAYPRANPSTDPLVIRVRFDRFGDLYPTDAAFDSATFVDRHFAGLWNYYRSGGDKGAHWKSLRPAGSPTAPGSRPICCDDDWAALQDSLFSIARTEILRATNGGTSPLVVLVHGFNAGLPELGYNALRMAVVKREFGGRPDAAAFLELYWDGSSAGNDLTSTLHAWYAGQANMYPTGLSLRRLLNGLPATMPLRFLTHSLGGALVSSAMWNLDFTIHKGLISDRADSWYQIYRSRQQDSKRYMTPAFSDLRVGMIVPAMPIETFIDDSARTPRGAPWPYQRIVVGANPHDFAVTRAPLSCKSRPLGLGVGGTCAAVSIPELVKQLVARCTMGRDTLAYVVSFAHSQTNTLRDPAKPNAQNNDEHALTSYVARTEEINRFLSLVFDSALTPRSRDGCRPATTVLTP